MPPGKDKDFGLSPEISRLSAILARDPNSKLFIALAEEYMKAGMAQEAALTLEKGLTANPFYMSARVMLGKAFLETGETHKAREQFETVVRSVPDNLLAHKKLSEIYLEQGRPADAARSLKMVTLLNPKDEEAKKALADLESVPTSAPRASQEPSGNQEPPGASAVEVDSRAFDPEKIMYHDLAKPVEPDIQEAGREAPVPEYSLEDVEESAPVYPAEPDVIEMPVPDNMATLEDIPYAVEAELVEEPELTPLPDEPAPSAEEEAVPGEPGEAAGYGLKDKGELEDIFASYRDASPREDSSGEGAEGVYEIEGEISGFEMEGVKTEPAVKEPFETETLAELYISQGFFDRAINIYKNLLMELPGDTALKQKLEDLYLLASVNSTLAGAGTDAAVESAEAVDFEEPEEAEIYEEAEAGRESYDTGAVRRLEQFLDNIRRKAGR